MEQGMFPALLVCLAVAQPVSPEAQAEQSPWKGSTEYVVWWIRRGYVPPIVTTSTHGSQGVLGPLDTNIVYGDQRLETRHNDRFIGTRFALEWREPGGLFGLEGRAFFLERDSTYFTLKPQSDRLLALSYIDANTSQQASEIFAGTDPARGLLWGGFVGYSRIELFGQEANVTAQLWEDDKVSLDLLIGTRFLQMRDRYHHTATSFILPEKSQLFGVIDNYRVGNAFYGGQVGLRSEYRWDRVYVQARGAIALGADDQLVRTWGQRIDHNPQRRIQIEKGLFVQPSNTGTFRRCNFDAVGEFAVNVGFDISGWLRGYAGYTFLAWADPMRAANQVDRLVNPSQPTGVARPALPFTGEALWAQGVNVGLEARW
jgi:hypothetical protein